MHSLEATRQPTPKVNHEDAKARRREGGKSQQRPSHLCPFVCCPHCTWTCRKASSRVFVVIFLLHARLMQRTPMAGHRVSGHYLEKIKGNVAEAPAAGERRQTIGRGDLLPRPNPPRKVAGGHGEIADRRSSVDFKEEAPKHGVRGMMSLCLSQPLVIHSLSGKNRKC